MTRQNYRPSHLPLPPPQSVRVLNVLDVSKDLGIMRLARFPVEISWLFETQATCIVYNGRTGKRVDSGSCYTDLSNRPLSWADAMSRDISASIEQFEIRNSDMFDVRLFVSARQIPVIALEKEPYSPNFIPCLEIPDRGWRLAEGLEMDSDLEVLTGELRERFLSQPLLVPDPLDLDIWASSTVKAGVDADKVFDDFAAEVTASAHEVYADGLQQGFRDLKELLKAVEGKLSPQPSEPRPQSA